MTRIVPLAGPQPDCQVIVAGRAIAAENTRCSEAEWGGFDTCSFDVQSRPDWSEHGLRAFADVAVYYQGESIFEGRVADVSKETGEGCTRRVDCRGYFDEFKDDDCLRRCYRDQDLTSWQDRQVDSNAGKFDVTIEDDEVSIRQQDDVPYFTSNSARVVLQITGGVSISGEALTGLEITLVDTIT